MSFVIPRPVFMLQTCLGFWGFLLLLIISVYRDRKSGCHKRREERQDFAGTFDDMWQNISQHCGRSPRMFKLLSCIVWNHVLNTFILESLDLHTLKKQNKTVIIIVLLKKCDKEVCVLQVFPWVMFQYIFTASIWELSKRSFHEVS